MIEGVADALRLRDREALSRTRRLDDVLDGLNREIKQYVTRLDPDSMTDDEHRRLEVILTFSLNLESAGDVIERNITAFAAKNLKRGVELRRKPPKMSQRRSTRFGRTFVPQPRFS